nr:FGGY family carbohydrate kinase [Candidatus Calescibacterium sp.]
MGREYILTIDAGTSSLKSALFDERYSLVAQDKVEYAYEADGLSVQIDPNVIWQAFLQVVRNLRDRGYAKDITLIVPCVFSPALIAMDRDGTPLFPAIIHWDRRSVRQARRAIQLVGKEKFLAIAGNIPYPGGISLTSMLWLKEERPEVFRKASVLGHLNTFLLKKLVGRWLIDPTNASVTGLYETTTGSGWSEELTRELGIPCEKLPPVVSSLEVAGYVSEEVANLTGLRSGVPVLAGSNDTSAAAVGAGLLREGQVLNISGSSEILVICLERPLPSEQYYLRTHPFPGKWLMYDIVIGGFALEWFRTQFCRELSEVEFYDSYLRGVLERGDRTRVRCIPYLAGDRTSLVQKRASFSGLTLDTTREECLAALVEGIVGRMQRTLRAVSQKVAFEGTMVLTGGASAALFEYKKRVFHDFEVVRRENCSILGCLELAKRYFRNACGGTGRSLHYFQD